MFYLHLCELFFSFFCFLFSFLYCFYLFVFIFSNGANKMNLKLKLKYTRTLKNKKQVKYTYFFIKTSTPDWVRVLIFFSKVEVKNFFSFTFEWRIVTWLILPVVICLSQINLRFFTCQQKKRILGESFSSNINEFVPSKRSKQDGWHRYSDLPDDLVE